jgi:alkanesulfonate monooxygenase SsuD/methylene tetrahydromethanopterin reductase-like flavin-dependent oxidoreductase (luciferase family)
VSVHANATTSIGYTLSSEEHGPTDLVALAAEAEEAGFDFLTISDHYHPWTGAQGHSPFVWSVLGGVAAVTDAIEVAVGVTCPTIRIHPAILAQATATTSLLFEGRFSWGVGSGEALNEHILGHRWPRPEVRLRMLEEASTAPDAEVIGQYEAAGGAGPRFGQVHLCWSEDEDEARRTVHEVWPTVGVPGQLSQDLPTWTHFEQVSELVTEDMVAEKVPCGPDPEPVVEAVREHVDAGYDHIHLHQIGPDQEGFLRFWAKELRPALEEQELVGV